MFSLKHVSPQHRFSSEFPGYILSCLLKTWFLSWHSVSLSPNLSLLPVPWIVLIPTDTRRADYVSLPWTLSFSFMFFPLQVFYPILPISQRLSFSSHPPTTSLSFYIIFPLSPSEFHCIMFCSLFFFSYPSHFSFSSPIFTFFFSFFSRYFPHFYSPSQSFVLYFVSPFL